MLYNCKKSSIRLAVYVVTFVTNAATYHDKIKVKNESPR